MGRQGGNIIVLSSFFEKYIYFMLGVQFPILSVLNRQYQFLTDISLAKDKTGKVAKDTKIKFKNNNGRMDVNQHTNPTGNYTRFNNKISIEDHQYHPVWNT